MIPNNSLQTTTREIITNNTYKLLSENDLKSYIYDNDIYVNTTRFLKYVWAFFNIICMKRLNSTLRSTTLKINQ